MGLVEGTLLALLGLTGVASFLFRKWEDGRMLVLCLVQFGIGGWSVLTGFWYTLNSVLMLEWAVQWPAYWLLYVTHGVLELALGVALLAGMALTLMTGPKERLARSGLRQRIAVAQLVAGALMVALGVGTVVYGFVVTVIL